MEIEDNMSNTIMMEFKSWKQPNEDVVKHFANAFDISYYKCENELKDLFSSDHALTEERISLRVVRLNALYHIHLWDIHIADIVEFLKQGECIKFENRILGGDLDAVKELAERDNRNCFVFATKYCSFANPEIYPIYDSLVASVLMYFHKMNPLVNGKLDFEEIRQNCDYRSFKSIVDEFKMQYGLERCSYKEIDQFLWLVGKNES